MALVREVLDSILGFLTRAECICSRQVCQQWSLARPRWCTLDIDCPDILEMGRLLDLCYPALLTTVRLEHTSKAMCSLTLPVVLLVQRAVNIQRLALSCKHVTVAGFMALRGLRKLEVLKLYYGHHLTDASLGALVQQLGPQLRWFELTGLKNVTRQGMDVLTRLPAVCKLFLRQCPADDLFLQNIMRLPRLTELECSFWWQDAFDPRAVPPISDWVLCGLKSANFELSDFGRPGLTWLSHCAGSTLEELVLERCVRIETADIIDLIPKFPRLRILNLNYCWHVQSSSLKHVASVQTLQALEIKSMVLSPGDEMALTMMLNLTELNMAGMTVSELQILTLLKGAPKKLKLLNLGLCEGVSKVFLQTCAAKYPAAARFQREDVPTSEQRDEAQAEDEDQTLPAKRKAPCQEEDAHQEANKKSRTTNHASPQDSTEDKL
jgi:hypothetical protein